MSAGESGWMVRVFLPKCFFLIFSLTKTQSSQRSRAADSLFVFFVSSCETVIFVTVESQPSGCGSDFLAIATGCCFLWLPSAICCLPSPLSQRKRGRQKVLATFVRTPPSSAFLADLTNPLSGIILLYVRQLETLWIFLSTVSFFV